MTKRIEKMEANGLGWQIIGRAEARAILGHYGLTLRNLTFYGRNLNGVHIRFRDR